MGDRTGTPGAVGTLFATAVSLSVCVAFPFASLSRLPWAWLRLQTLLALHLPWLVDRSLRKIYFVSIPLCFMCFAITKPDNQQALFTCTCCTTCIFCAERTALSWAHTTPHKPNGNKQANMTQCKSKKASTQRAPPRRRSTKCSVDSFWML